MPASENVISTPAEPLCQIGLAISGGGFRAAAFGLGCLSYLDRCVLTDASGQTRSLLERVSFMSTTSGGSFVSLLYARNLYQQNPFSDTYRALRDIMDGEQLLSDALHMLNDPDAWRSTPDKQRNLINAYALACNQRFGGATFELLCQADNSQLRPHLRQICVNATEFVNGISFRFQNIDGQTRTGLVGNYNLYLRQDALDTIRKLRLGDIMAASSCFPAGFEPLVFPKDFTYQDQQTTLSVTELLAALVCRNAVDQTADLTNQLAARTQVLSEVKLTIEAERADERTEQARARASVRSSVPDDFSFGLMDGGIDDNQGIQGLLLGNSRNQRYHKGHGFDTFIVCDADSPYMDPYAPPTSTNRGLQSLSITKLAALAAILLVIVPAIISCWATPVVQAVLLTFAGLMFMAGGGLLLWLWREVQSVDRESVWRHVIQTFGGYLFHVPVGTVYQMIVARLSSVVLLADDVFMRQIRRLTYQLFYGNRRWAHRRISTLIYELSTNDYPITEARNSGWSSQPQPSSAMKQVAETARSMPTTLWFDPAQVKAQTRDKIIATGQFTTCYNLMKYIHEVENAPVSMVPGYQTALDELKRQLEADWQAFQTNPLWLVDSK